jgi:hypothetical protein
MGDAAGIDLGTAVSAAARWRGDVVVPRLVPTADLAGPGGTAGALAALARVAGDPAGPAPAVAVVVPALDAGRRAEVEEAARATFGAPVLTPRPVAAAAWFRYRHDVRTGASVVVVEGDDGAEGPAVVVTVVRDGVGGPAVEGGSTGGLIGPRDPARDAVEIVALALQAAALVPTAADVAVVIGGAAWLDAVVDAITEVTGLAAVVEPEPESAAACGAALLAGGPGGQRDAAGGGTSALGGAAGALSGGAAFGPGGGLEPGVGTGSGGVTEGGAVVGALGTAGAPGGATGLPAVPGEAAGGAMGDLAAGLDPGAGGDVGSAVGGLGGPGSSAGELAGGFKAAPGGGEGAAGLKSGPGGGAGEGVAGLKAGPGGGGGEGVAGLKSGPGGGGGEGAAGLKASPGGGAGDAAGGSKAPPAGGGEGVDGLKAPPGAGGGWRRMAAGARRRAPVLAPAVVAVVVLGGIGVRSCTQSPDGQSLVAAGSAADGGGDPGDGDRGDSGGGGEAGPRGSGKDDVAEQTTSTTAAEAGTTVAGRTTTTAGRGGATTSGPGTDPGGSGTEPAGGTTTPSPADTTPPAITNLSRSNGRITPGNLENYCLDPTTTTLSATVTDDGGVGSVVAHWSTDRHSDSITLHPDGQGNYTGTLGPVAADRPFPLPVTWYVEATDLAGNRATATAGGRGAVEIDCVPILN